MKTCPSCTREYIDTQQACPLDESQLGAPTSKPMPVGVGRVLGNYRLICLLGEGGMGNIYIAAHTRLNRYAAIKLLKPELQGRKDAIARFFEEARAINKLKHPNIVESLDLVEDVVDGAYCVLELLNGLSLKQWMVNGRLPLTSSLRIGAQIADALHAVHSAGIVHRDLKPDNLILIEKQGRGDFVKLIDFGVAQVSHDEADGVAGTAAYMAPEQAAGERVDGRADIYSLGVLLFEMVTGFHPFPSTNDHEYTLRHADDTPPRPSKVTLDVPLPKELDTIILRCLEKRPEGRYGSAAEVAAALRAVDPVPKKKRTGLVVTLGLLTGAGIGAALVLPDYLQSETASAQPEVARAPAPTPTPTPTPEATPSPSESPQQQAQPDTITLKFASTPAGAKVFRKGETIALGITPFETTLVKSDHSTPVRFELDGYEAMEVDASLEKSETISVTLDKLPPPPVALESHDHSHPKTTTKPKPLQREGTMDPFATKKN